MTHLTLPDYDRGKLCDTKSIKDLTNEQLLRGYLVLNARFKFPPATKYPSIPCYADKTTTVYPLSGSCILTGPEYLLARNQKCEFEVKSAFFIPPVEKMSRVGPILITRPMKPFQSIISELQSKRREFNKGHVMNALYKELANSIYGNVVRGISNKKSFDTKTRKMIRVSGTELSNPILAS